MQQQQKPSSIPILHRHQLSQPHYKQTDFQIQVYLGLLQLQKKQNKDPKYTIMKKLYIGKKQVVLSFEKKPINRLMAILGKECQENFMFLSFENYQVDRNYVKSCLLSPIVINKEAYHFLGYSKSNLKEFCCYFYKASEQHIWDLLNSFGHFDQIDSVSKKAARLSLLYSDSNFVCSLKDQQIHIIKDIYRSDLCFTDGCGYISLALARRIKKHIQNIQYLPSVYQIRIKGIKGIVLLNPSSYSSSQLSSTDSQFLTVRESMIKFKAKQNKLQQLVLVNYSKPSRHAAINQQIIMLLSGLGISDHYLLDLQDKYLQLLRQAMSDPVGYVELLGMLGKDDLVQEVLRDQNKREFKVKSIISQQIYRNIKNKQLKNRLRIPLKNARFLYGAVYPQSNFTSASKSILSSNQIFLRITIDKDTIRTITGRVLVTKNPCYYCGDIRILEAIDISEEFPFANKLVDVVIFSTEGDMPVGASIAGSDYDGDQYFVCWDQELIPKRQIIPYTYPMTPAKKVYGGVRQADLVNYFVNFDRSIVGVIDHRFRCFANASKKGVRCEQCVQLGTKLFSRAIDSANTGQKVYLPDHLQAPTLSEHSFTHVWTKMTQIYESFFINQFKFDDELLSSWDISYEMMLQVIQTYVAYQHYNDYQLFKIIKSWYLSKKCRKYDLFKYVDFSQLTKIQKREIKELQNFPQQYLGNPFEYSPIFSSYLFQKYKIQFHTYAETPKKWRAYYKTQGDDLNFETIQQALTKFSNVLIGIQVNKEVCLVFSINCMKKTAFSQNYIPEQCLKSYYAGVNELQVLNLGEGYKLYYSDELFQIYQKQRRNSFFWFRGNQVSIDLTRFDRNMLLRHKKITKETIKYVEVYVGLSQNYKEKQQPKILQVSQSMDQQHRLQPEEDDLIVKKNIFKDDEKKKYTAKKYVEKNEQPKKKYVQKK